MRCECVASMWRLACALVYLFILWPISVVFALGAWFVQLITYSPALFLLAIVAGVGIPITKFHDRVQSGVEYFMRCIVFPIWHNVLLPIWELFEVPYNLLICWWDANVWAAFGYMTDIVFPGFLKCGARQLFINAAPIFRIFLSDFLGGYLATGNFLHDFFDYGPLANACVNFMNAWVDMWCCLCMDLCILFRCAPIPILFIGLPFIQVSGYLMHQDFYLAAGALLNLAAALLQQIVRLIIQIFTVGFGGIDPRPDIEVANGYWCIFNQHFFRATELVIQCFWDGFMPWAFNWIRALCVLDTFACLLGDLAVVGFRIIVNVDRVFLDAFTPDPTTGTGPRPGSVWHGSIKTIAIRFFNTIAPITDPAFHLDVHIVGRSTFIECLCLLLRRIICDPSDSNTACFSQGAASFLENFDFCCLTNSVLTFVNDFTKGLYELFLNATDATVFFRWVDSNPNYQILIGYDGDLVSVVACLLSSLQFIPVVGFCLKHIFVSIFAFVTGMIAFAVRGVLSLTTLPYFLIVLHQFNLLLRPGELLALYEGPINLLVAQAPDSFLNCLCYVLNSIHIPPITLDVFGNFVPCGCQPVGYIPPPAVINDKLEYAFDWTTKGDYLSNRFSQSAINKLTPILVYEIESEIEGRGERVINPIYLKERILENMALYGATVIPELARDVDQFIALKTAEIREKWAKIKHCQAERQAAEYMRVKYPWRYKYLAMKGELPGQKDCADFEQYMIPYGSLGPVDQLAYDYGILSRNHYAESVLNEELAGRNNTYFAKLTSDAASHWEQYAQKNMQFSALNQDERYNATSNITVSTTQPAVLGCPGPGQPLLPCFDVCCIVRSSIQLIAHTMLGAGRLVNALIQGNFQNPGWQYFTGVSCPACFELDLVTLIRRLVGPIACGCRLFDLILPSSPNYPRPDLCCSITYVGDFVGGILQVIINGIKSLALDSPNFFYFVEGGFMNDANVLFDLTLDIVACLCNVVRYTFPIYQLTGGGFDPCCLGENVFLVLVEAQRLLLQIIINLALIVASPTAIAYWRDQGISRGYAIIDNIGFVKQADVVIDAIFGKAGGICATQGRDQGQGGISQCVCQILSTIIPIRPSPGLPVHDPDNCPIFDICCPIRGISFMAGEWTKFQLRVLVSTWQSWNPSDYGKPPGAASPIAFLDFLFCNEDNPQGEPGCGKLYPTINAFISVIVACPCQFGELADAWLTMVLPAHNFQCFCGPTDGFFTNVGGLIESITLAITTLIRRISQPSYWAFTQGGPSVNSIQDSWAFRFAGPTINYICNLVTSVLCVTNSIIGLPCTEYQKRIVRSVIRWVLESALRTGAFIQGFILIFASGVNSACPPPTQCPDDGQCPAGNYCTPMTGSCDTPCPSGAAGSTNISVAQLANAFVSLFSYVFDLLISDSTVLCSVRNPPMCHPSDPCCCYNPAGSYKYQPVGGIYTVGHQCAQCLNDDCTLLVNSFAFPTCTVNPCTGHVGDPPPCDPQTGLFKPKECVNMTLISCDPYNPNLNPLDGIVIAILRYMRCMIATLISSDLAKAFDAIISLCSFIWQIFTPILRFIASLILFVILLFGFLNGGCACFGAGRGQFVQRGGLCYPCEESDKIRHTWWSDADKMHNGNWEPKPDNGTTWPDQLCVAGFNYPASEFLNATNIRAIDNRMCIDQVLAGGPGGCPSINGCGNGGCGPIAANVNEYPAKCQFCNFFDNDRGEVGNSIDCDIGCSDSCTACGANSRPLCGIIQLWEAFGDIFQSFIQVFTKPPINPDPPAGGNARGAPKKRDPKAMPWHDNPTPRPGDRAHKSLYGRSSRVPFHEFKRRTDYDLNGGIFTGGNAITMMVAAAWDYDIEDCPDDLRTCVCRNMPIPSAACSIGTPQLERAMRSRDRKAIDDLSAPVIAHLAEEARQGGNSRCEYLLAAFGTAYNSTNMTWSQLDMSEQVEYIGCLDKMIQGLRLNTVMPSFPKKYFYTNTGPLDFLANIQAEAIHNVKKSRDYTHFDRKFENDRKRAMDPKMEERAMEMKRDIAVRRQNILKETAKDRRWDNSMVLSFFLELDEYEYKLRSGWFKRQLRDAMYNIQYGTWSVSFASWWDGLKDQTAQAAGNVYAATWRKTLDDMYRGVGASFGVLDDVVTRGPYKMWTDAKERVYNLPENVANRKRAADIRAITIAAWYEGPLYKWWTQRTGTYLDYGNPFGVFVDHMRRNFNFHRENWRKMEPNAFTIDLHAQENWAMTIGKRWEKKWTPQKLANWESVGRIFYRFKEAFAPGSLTKAEHERFLIDGNCYLVDGLIDEIIFLVSYCSSDFMPNYPLTKKIELRNSSAAWRWFEGMAERGERMYGLPSDRKYIPEDMEAHNKREESKPWTDTYDWAMSRGLNWVRFKVRPAINTVTEERSRTLRYLTKQQWAKVVTSAPLDASSWFIGLLDRAFNTDLQREFLIIFQAIEDFVNNDNLDYMAGPIGLKYVLMFPLRCQAKPSAGQLPSNAFINLNCSVGIGLEAAIGWVGLISFLVFVVGSVIFPGTMLPLTGGTAVIFFVVLIPALAWHYSPRCWLMTPAFAIGGISGVTVPLLPFPLAPPALPFCLMSEFRHLINKYITNCYRVLWGGPLEFFFRPQMIIGESCPTCPTRVLMRNCGDLGFGGGVSNVVYILHLLWPDSATVARDFGSLWIFQQGGLLGSFAKDVVALFDKFKTLTPDQIQQFNDCSIWTSFSITSVIIIAFFVFTLIPVLWRLLLDLISAIVAVFVASPFMYLIPGTSNSMYHDYMGDDPAPLSSEQDPDKVSVDDALIGVQLGGAGEVDGFGRPIRRPRRQRRATVSTTARRGAGRFIMSGIIDDISMGIKSSLKLLKRE